MTGSLIDAYLNVVFAIEIGIMNPVSTNNEWMRITKRYWTDIGRSCVTEDNEKHMGNTSEFYTPCIYIEY